MRYLTIILCTLLTLKTGYSQNWRLPYEKALDQVENGFGIESDEQALKYAKQAYEEVIKLPEYSNEQLTMSHDLAQLLYNLGDHATAASAQLLSLKSSINVYGEKSKNYLEQLGRLTYYKLEFSDFKVASLLCNKYLDASKDIAGRKSSDYIKANIYLGLLNRTFGNFSSSEGYFQMAIDIASELDPYSTEHAMAATGISKLLITQGRYTEAEVMLRKAIHIYQKAKKTHTLDYAEALLQFGYLNSILRNFDSADKNLSAAKTILEKQTGHMSPLRIEYNMIYGHTYIVAGYPEHGKDHVELAYTGSKHNPYLHGTSLLLKARYYAAINDFTSSDSLYEHSLSKLKTIVGQHHFMYATALNNYGEMLYKKGEYEQAVLFVKKGLNIRKEILEITHPDYLKSITNLSLIYWAQGDMKKASRYFNKSTARYIHQYRTQFVFLSEKEKTLFYKAIREYFEKYNSFALAYHKENPKVIGNIYNNQLVSKGLLFNSTKDLRESIFRKTSIFEKYNRYISTRELLSRTYNVTSDDILNDHNLDIDSLENTANYLEKELSFRIEESKTSEERQKEFEELFLNWKDLRYVLKKDEAAIEIVRYRTFDPKNGGAFQDSIVYLALCIDKKTKGQPNLITFEDGNYLESGAMKNYRNSIKYKIRDKYTYERYWKPIASAPALKEKNHIYLAPDGIYNQISLNTLRNPDKDTYVLDEYQIQIVSNTKDVINQKSKKKQNINYSNSLLMGYPDYNEKKIEGLELASSDGSEATDTRALPKKRGFLRGFLRGGQGIAQLPGTKVEVESIDQILKENNKSVDLKIDKDADEEVLKAINGETFSPSIVHIATHGYFQNIFDEDNDSTESVLRSKELNPLALSGLLLSGATFSQTDLITEKAIDAWEHNEVLEDGNLTAYEAMNLNLFNTDMVILSACETGLGVVQNGEGVYGLQRAFQTAGAKTVVMSLWKVDDRATQDFMIEFYREYFATSDKRKAFYNAQIKLREKYPEPYYWGAFVMIGE